MVELSSDAACVSWVSETVTLLPGDGVTVTTGGIGSLSTRIVEG